MLAIVFPVAFEVLAEPHRREIVTALAEAPRLVGELSQLLDLSQPATSKHLRVLRDAKLVRVEVVGNRRRYHLRSEPLAELDAWLQPLRWMWLDRLDALGDHLDHIGDREVPE